MYSIYKGGIKNIFPEKKPISIKELVQLIKNNPQVDKIEEIRKSRKEGDQTYKELKRILTYITPNAVLKKRDLKDRNNFIFSSGYVYLDFDNLNNVAEFKNEFIKKYNQIVSLVCISSSAGGISVLINVDLDITLDNFKAVWEFLVNNIFTDVANFVDERTKDIGRAMFVSSDPEVFFNYENKITIDPSDLENIRTELINEKGATQCITERGGFNTLSCTFPYKLLDYNKVHGVINTKTPVNVTNPVVDFNPIDYTCVRFPTIINDGLKHRIYTLLIHFLVHLNPDLQPDYIYSFIYYLNKSKAEPKMNTTELQRLFILVYNKTQEPNYKFNNDRIKNFHINPNSGLNMKDKIVVMNTLNGKIKCKKSIDKILEAKVTLKSNNEQVTQKKIVNLSGLSLRTVKKYYHVAEPIDIINVTSDINKQYQYVSTVTTTINIESTFISTDDVVINIVSDVNDWKQLDSLF